jgi:hypothetical protein
MKALARNILISVVMSSAAVVTGQQPSDQSAVPAQNDSNRITVGGCIRSERQSYIVIADQTGVVYALQGVGNRLQSYLRKQVEVTGDIKPGSVKTGVRLEKSGSNPSDTVHGSRRRGFARGEHRERHSHSCEALYGG